MNITLKYSRQNTPHLRVGKILLAGAFGVLLACSMSACGQKNARISTHEADGSQAERVTKITKLLSKSGPLPGALLDANFVEEQAGDGRLGPSDFRSFYALKVAPADLPAWKAALSKSKPANTFSNAEEIHHASPKEAMPWWVSEPDVDQLEFFSPHSLTGNANGWVGIAPDGNIYIHVFTM